MSDEERAKANAIASQRLEDLLACPHSHRRLIRMLNKLKYHTLMDAFNQLAERDALERLGETYDDYCYLLDSFGKKPGEFAEELSGEHTGARHTSARQTGESSLRTPIDCRRSSVTLQRREDTWEGCDISKPRTEWSERLDKAQRVARQSLNDLATALEYPLISQCFPDMVEHLGFMCKDFPASIRWAKDFLGDDALSERQAVNMIRKYWPFAFLVYMADAARRCSDGQEVWPPLFKELGISYQSVQNQVKELVRNSIENAGFPVFENDDGGRTDGSPRYYADTLLLHAGLSEPIWKHLWKRVLLPVVDEPHPAFYNETGKLASEAFAGLKKCSLSGGGVIAERILRRCPSYVVVPMLDEALRVAFKLKDARCAGEAAVPVLLEALPEDAVRALKEVVRSSARSIGEADGGSDDTASELIAYPEVKLSLPMQSDDDRPIVLRVAAKDYDRSHPYRILEVRVNGEKTHIESQKTFSGIRFPRTEIMLPLCDKYFVEMRFVAKDGPEEEGVNESAPIQCKTFLHSRPGVYEFVEDGNGAFVLRRDVRSGVRKGRRVAYLIAPGYQLHVDGGTVEQRYAPNGDLGASLWICSIESGMCVSVENADGEELARWSENLAVQVENATRIGKNRLGNDVYGTLSGVAKADCMPHAYYYAEINPEIKNGLRPYLAICSYDGVRREIDPRILPDKRRGDLSAYEVSLPEDTPSFVKDGRLKLFDQRTNKEVFCYRFSVVPVCEVALRSVRFYKEESGELFWATYVVNLSHRCLVDGETDGAKAVCSFEREASLADEYTTVTLHETESMQGFEFRLMLAGISIRLGSLLSNSGPRPNLCDAVRARGPECHITVEARGDRLARGMYVSLGRSPLFYKLLTEGGTYEIRALNRSALTCRLDVDADDPANNDQPLTVSINFKSPLGDGDAGGEGVVIAHVDRGFGIRRATFTLVGADSDVRLLKLTPRIETTHLCLRFRAGDEVLPYKGRWRPSDEDGDYQLIVLPSEVDRMLKQGRRVELDIAAKPPFGRPDFANCQTIILNPEARR